LRRLRVLTDGGGPHANKLTIDEQASARERQAVSDEVVFWYALQGMKIDKLKALLKTGVLKGDKKLAALLEHPKIGDVAFIRTNAFRLLQIHRYHLSASLFLLAGCVEDAAKVAAGHMRDLQLMLVLARRFHDAAAPLLLDTISDSALAKYDPWLRFLLLLHAADYNSAQKAVEDAPVVNQIDFSEESMLPVFDGSLRPSLDRCDASFKDAAYSLLARLKPQSAGGIHQADITGSDATQSLADSFGVNQ
jgi:hypothetical protein